LDAGIHGKAALITGGGTGIGRAIALALAGEGVDVAIASRNFPEDTLEEISSRGVRALGLTVDVTDEAQVTRMVAETVEGLGRLDFFVNNAAGAWNEPVTGISTENWLRTINTNLSACVWACREVSKYLIGRGHGSVLIVGSTAVWNPLYQESSYRVSKTGLKAFMEILAIELAPFGIRVNMLTPGLYLTRLTADFDLERQKRMKADIPMRRSGQPEELGASAVLLLSDRLSSYTTGSELVVDGGLKLRPIPLFSDEEIRNLNLSE
jgi:2-deoxy-D-gluconate 3-dehydrogenase